MIENSQVIKLCQRGMEFEAEEAHDSARKLYMRAWDISSDSYESCIAAHFVARQQNNPENKLYWNRESLRLADETGGDSVKSFYPSLLFCIGSSYEDLKDFVNARKYFDLAKERMSVLDNDSYGKNLRRNVDDARKRTEKTSMEI